LPGKFGGGLHPALIPILLAMSQGESDLEKTLDDLANFIQSTKSAVEAMRSGIETFHASMLKMAPPPMAGKPGKPLTWPGWDPHPQKQPEPGDPVPVKEPDTAGDDSPGTTAETASKDKG
jgi:hypothetical protein